jgi:DNA replication licensing factor MCM2
MANTCQQVRHLEAIMRIAEAFCKMRLSEYCSAQDIDRAIAVTVDSFIGSQKVSCKKALSRTLAKYVPPHKTSRLVVLTQFT